MAESGIAEIFLDFVVQTAARKRRKTPACLILPDIAYEVGELDDLEAAQFARFRGRRRSISATLPANPHVRFLAGGGVGRVSDNKAAMKAFASFPSRIAKFAAMLDVAMSCSSFRLQYSTRPPERNTERCRSPAFPCPRSGFHGFQC